MPERRSLRGVSTAVLAAVRSAFTRLRGIAATIGVKRRNQTRTSARSSAPARRSRRNTVPVVPAALAAIAAVTVLIVVVVVTLLPERTDAERRGARDELSRVPSELRVPDWQLPDSTEVLHPPILMIRSESGPWDRSEIEPFMYDSVDAVREHLRRENDAALRRLFSRVP